MVRSYEPIYTIKEAAKVLRVNPTFVYGEISKGRLPCLIIGSKKVRGSDLESYIEKHPAIAAGEVISHEE